ncbi:hypothetical protein BCR37DRAFT_391811 [Protomyces lactucae-debilis]|uniref:HotDog domain-containing protein n=1 Tax=Protomyces lactucae-debilis TaxID=2754530 RepID=A0A1Y2FJS4_PROLT|nr:uncharacterized protein BCR37DRAFT_391811 [Protomyces lactucae-debilis]ORY84208.1 hypothetical protein BCR37DRAFT_391811 [Protomyces lactucae-debilis]
MAGAWSVLKWTAALLYLLNYKHSFFQWHLRFFWQCIKHTITYKLMGGAQKSRIAASTNSRDLWASKTYQARASLGDIDFNFHKSNSTYAADADMARTSFCLQMFDQLMIGNFKLYVALGGVSSQFRKQIDMYESYTLETKILAWYGAPATSDTANTRDEKWLFLSTRFVGAKNETKAQMLSQYIFKQGRATLRPETVFEKSGYRLTEADHAKNKEQVKLAQGLLALKDVAALW